MTLAKLFEGWPREKLAQLHSDTSDPPVALCGHAYALKDQSYGSHGFSAVRRAIDQFQWLRGRSDAGLLWASPTPRLLKWLGEFAPELIVSQTGNLAFLRLTREITEYTGAKLVIHASDDWVNDWPTNVTHKRIPVISNLIARTTRGEFAELVDIASSRLAISTRMAEVYTQRYGSSWQVFCNAVDPRQWPVSQNAKGARSGPFRLLYTGSLVRTSQLDTVILVAQAIAQLASEGESVVLELANPRVGTAYPAVLNELGVVRSDLVPQDLLPQKLAAADLLLLPVTFDPNSFHFIHLSIPGKTSEYMISGTPILAVGPALTATISYASTEGWAEVVTDGRQGAIAQAIRRLMNDAHLRTLLAHRAREIAMRDCDLTSMRPRFQAHLQELVLGVDHGS